MASLFQTLRWLHIAAGFSALVLFCIPAIARKGGKAHIRAGWFYVVCMSVVVLTAFSMSAMVFVNPLAVRSLLRPLAAEELTNFLRGQRIFAAFLAYLAGITLAAGWQGIWVLRTRRQPQTFRTPFKLVLNALVAMSGLAMLYLGIRYRSAVLMGLSPIGPLVSGGNLRYLLRGPETKMAWWYEHLGSMIGTGIAAYTAFLVFGGSRLFPAIARSQLYAIFWVLPTLIGVPAIYLTVAYYRRKFHEDGRRASPVAARIGESGTR